tara:strand:+ start:916 stop:1434 length:519 start_codon:yes stop_codon:yes gene_type:complete
MKKIFNLSILFFFINLSFASSEIFYIDIERLINFSEPGKYINEKITDSNKISDEKFNKIRDNLKQKEELLISQKNILNKKEFNSKLSDLQMEVEKFNIENNKRLKIQQQKLLNYKRKLIEKMEPILIDYMKENNISYLLRKQNILIGREDFNKTEAIMLLVNKKINKEFFDD